MPCPVPFRTSVFSLGFLRGAKGILHEEVLESYTRILTEAEFKAPQSYIFRGNILFILVGNSKSWLIFIILKEHAFPENLPFHELSDLGMFRSPPGGQPRSLLVSGSLKVFSYRLGRHWQQCPKSFPCPGSLFILSCLFVFN